MLTARQILLTLNAKFNGNWDKIYHAIVNKCDAPTQAEYDMYAKDGDFDNLITIIDSDYPAARRNTYKPAFVIKRDALTYGVFYHYGDTGEEDLCMVFATEAEAKSQARLFDNHVPSDCAEQGDYYYAKAI